MSHLKDTEINGQKFSAIVEAILFAADRPLAAADIARIIRLPGLVSALRNMRNFAEFRAEVEKRIGNKK